MKVLIVYHSFTGQAQIIADRLSELLRESGHDPVCARLVFDSPDEPVVAPVPFSVIARWGDQAKKGIDLPIRCEPGNACEAKFDAAIVLSNTWSFHPSVPVQCFLRGAGRTVLPGIPVAIGIVCRGFWKKNLRETSKLVESAGGRVISSEVFTHAGSWLASTITNILGMTKPLPVPRRFGPLVLPAFGVSPASMAKLPGFVERALAGARA